jgi:hypothetical protein
MNFLKNLLPAGYRGVVCAGICHIAAASAIVLIPVIYPHCSAQAAIDETMPTAVPNPVIDDWKDQDFGSYFGRDTAYTDTAAAIAAQLPPEYVEKFNAQKPGLSGEKLYLLACHFRRVSKMKKHGADLENIMFARHHNFGGICVGYHDNSDTGNSDNEWEGKGALCILNLKNYYSPFREILARKDAVLRDPCISFDGKKVLFAISGKGKGKGYKIYEMEIADTTTLRQLTFDPEGMDLGANKVADFEPCYLPNGDIMFTSTRNFGMSAKGYKPTTNMFVMNGQGKYIRQVGFDQAHTFYPVLLDDGAVLYTRLEFNDRMITGSMGLFTMNPDGSHQTEYFGNQTPWPMTMIHARPIPGIGKVIAVAGGYHGIYSGELMIIDHSQGYNGTQSVTMIAPKRATEPNAFGKKTDLAMGGVYFLFQNPCPLDENDFLVSWRKSEGEKIYRLYFMDVDGNRELLAWADQSVSQPVLIKSRTIPPKIVRQAQYNDSDGIFTMLDVYYGEGMKGISRGAAKTLRVVALHYRVAGGNIGAAMGSSPSGVYAPAITCPVSAYGASWEVKEVLGEAKIYEDGSAAFKVPARTPVYFQVLDSMGYCIATMRSWSTLMPGETFTCWGCHENKLDPPLTGVGRQPKVPQKLDAPLGIENIPFDYKQMVQPIFDDKCVKCHTADHTSGFELTGTLVSNSNTKKSWTTSYNSLLKGIGARDSNDAINICTIFSEPQQQPPRSFGSSLSGIMTKGGMSGSHHDVAVTATEKKIVACWIDLCAPHDGTYNSNMSASDSTKYETLLDKRAQWAAIEKANIKALLDAQTGVRQQDRGSAAIAGFITEPPGIRYIPAKHALVLKKFFRANVTVMDLRGRMMCHLKLSNRRTDVDVTIPLPAPLSKGLYVAKFESIHGIRQAKISITE